MKGCDVDGCTLPHSSKGLCRAHYLKEYRKKNKEHLLEQNREWHRNNRERNNLRAKQYKQEKPATIFVSQSRGRAKKLGVPFDLTEEYVLELIKNSEFCPVLGLKLVYGGGRGKQMPDSASLDRVVGTLGYVKGNVRIISWRANELKKDATLEELRCVYLDALKGFGGAR